MNVAAWLQRRAARTPSAPAVAHGNTVHASYGELAAAAASLAGGLRGRLGLVPGDRVVLLMTNHPRYVEIMLACWWAGLAPVPVNAKLHTSEVGHVLADSAAAVAFATADLEATLAAAARGLDPAPRLLAVGDLDGLRTEFLPLTEVAADGLAWLFYTSGTTGRPKGAMITHRNLRAMSYAYPVSVDAIGPGDALLHAAPMSHGSGIYMLPFLMVGGVQVVPESGGFEPEEVFRLIRHHPRSSLFAAPTMVRRLTAYAEAHRPETTNLQTIVYGGAPMYLADLEAAMAVLGPKLAQIYGQGESPMTITALDKAEHAATAHPRWRERLQSVGQPQTVCEVAIGDAAGNALPAGEVGEVMVRGDSVVPGYWRNEEATAKARRQGWWCTGDVGRLDADGYLTLLDRSKDLVITGGSNVYPREVEEVLLRHPLVQEVSVIGRRDAEWGEVVVAIVVAPGATTADLDAHCLAHIARFKRPKHYELVEVLPKNAYGKVLKTELRQRYG